MIIAIEKKYYIKGREKNDLQGLLAKLKKDTSNHLLALYAYKKTSMQDTAVIAQSLNFLL